MADSETENSSSLSRLLSSTGWYAVGAFAQKGVAFLMIPIYTRVIDPVEYGVLEVLNSFSAVLFTFLTVGLSSAVTKCFHRDCASEEDRAAVLPTALVVDFPILLLGGLVLWWFAAPVCEFLLGTGEHVGLMPLVAGNAMFFAATTVVVASLRAQERAQAFVAVSLVQFLLSVGLNIFFVVSLEMGVGGILLGNLISNVAGLPVGLYLATRGLGFRIEPSLVRPLLTFGVALVPVMLGGWVIDASDRYLLRVYRSLDDVALYGIGYRFGQILEVGIVWPFQLAWPAFSFAIASQADHKFKYARALTYLMGVMTVALLGVALTAPHVLALVVGEKYVGGHHIIPVVGLAYALGGVTYCVAPGIHLQNKTKYLPFFAAAAAAVNLGANLVLIPRLGMMGAAWSTVAAFAVQAGASLALAQRVHPVPYEYRRIGITVGLGALLYLAMLEVGPADPGLALAAGVFVTLCVLPGLLVALGLVEDDEWEKLSGLYSRVHAQLQVSRNPT